LDDAFRIKITDFGTGKLLDPGCMSKHLGSYSTEFISDVVDTAKTWVGTAQYVSPELLETGETTRRLVIYQGVCDTVLDN
jgi:3-phosphoinositide dependent protein kinase-1